MRVVALSVAILLLAGAPQAGADEKNDTPPDAEVVVKVLTDAGYKLNIQARAELSADTLGKGGKVFIHAYAKGGVEIRLIRSDVNGKPGSTWRLSASKGAAADELLALATKLSPKLGEATTEASTAFKKDNKPVLKKDAVPGINLRFTKDGGFSISTGL